MTVLDIAYIAVAAICSVVAVQNLLIALRVPGRRVQALFAVAAVGIVIDALASRRLYASRTPEEFETLLHATTVGICITLVALAWFLELRTGAARRWLLWGLTAAAMAVLVADFTVGVTYTEITHLRRVELPWHETLVLASGTATPWRLIGDITNIGFLVFLIDTALRLRRHDRHRSAREIGYGAVVYGVAMLTIIPVDLGYFSFPSLHTFAFLIIVLIMGWDMTLELARTSELSTEVAQNERRWRQLLERVQLLVARVDRTGYVTNVNPYYLEVTGHEASARVGTHVRDLIAVEDAAMFQDAMNSPHDHGVLPEVERVLTTSDGHERTIHWRIVLLRDARGEADGLLCVGADITERQEALAARDQALVELRRTVSELESLRTRLEEENLVLKEEVGLHHRSGDIVGESDAVRYVLSRIDHVAGSDATVLILGESGVGKELVARAIHQGSDRASKPFLAINCSALAPGVVESELFGHEKGAFTGADRMRRGRFELADGGTLLLDEIGELPLDIQPKLLRVLENGEFQRVGGDRTHRVDVRLIASTNRDLRREVQSGRFREDLYYRVEVYPITVPPLRDRREDIPLLVEHFARRISQRQGKRITEIDPDLIRRVGQYDWPGNIRELENIIERAVLTSPDGCLRLADPLGGEVSAGQRAGELDDPGSELEAGKQGGRIRTLREIETHHIARVLELCGGQIAGPGGAAEALGLHPNTLRSRMKKLGIGTPSRPDDVSSNLLH